MNKNLPKTMDELRFAILGAGMVAQYHKAAIEANSEKGAKLVAISHHRPESRHRIESEFGVRCVPYDDVLSDKSIDVVCICTPSGQHAAQSLAAIHKGKHVLVEKPMALSLNDAREMIKQAWENDVYLSVALQRRADPIFNRVYQAIQNGDLGTLTLASIVMPYFRDQAYYNQAPWRGTWSLDGGGVLMNQGIHIVDLLIWFMGDPVDVCAFAGTLQRDIEVEDALSATLRFQNGSMATIAATTTVGGGAPHRIEVYGTNGSIQIEGEGVTRWELNDPTQASVDPPSLQSDTHAGAGADPKGISTAGHTSIVKDLIGAIRERRMPAIDGREGMRSLSAVHAIYKAAGFSVPD